MNHAKYMRRCFEIAKSGAGKVAPNPLVGCVIVHNNKIIGEGAHQRYGGPHAEVNAIQAVYDKSLLCKSTMYVNLEPCSHHGKTPPCTDLIKKHNINHVVISNYDTSPNVSGNGLRIMQEAGIKVTTEVLEPEGRALNKRFFTFHEKKRPYIILKWAQTLDGFIDKVRLKTTPVGPIWITNHISRINVHKWRSEEQAIMVGTNTAEKDNPGLTTRLWKGKNPVRIVLDRSLRLPKNLKLFDNTAKTLVFNEKTHQKDGNIEFVKIDFTTNSLKNILHFLYQQQINSCIIEGGSQLLSSFIDSQLWDEARVFIGDLFFTRGVRAPEMPVTPSQEEHFGESRLFTFYNQFS